MKYLFIILFFLPLLLLATIKCPYCGAENPDNAKFCWRCGKPLLQNKGEQKTVEKVKPVQKKEEIRSENKEETKKENKIICPYCGAENPPDAKFCWRCGKPLFKEKIEVGPGKKVELNQAVLDSILIELREIKMEIKKLNRQTPEKYVQKQEIPKQKKAGDFNLYTQIFFSGCLFGLLLTFMLFRGG